MARVELQILEFTFSPPGLDKGPAKYHAMVVCGSMPSVVLTRLGSKIRPIGFDVQRNVAIEKAFKDGEAIVRAAIGQALRDGLFNNHPDVAVYLDVDAPDWDGNLKHIHKHTSSPGEFR
ncbi:MAG: hypothetical protein EPN70_18020 [Paraburkholderia sp.]|uniref:hypothetical protein n=1 Tax=Paraburkholderia sp. TaxID=1926495 RepID=UPI00120D60EE|nr:hypothetical protein [Paraburkholderia sp.]TAM02031.1 MAG: hypothetical protein EPN70_18020 [Paraburkholderia sp.]TAM32099.1 MAG: hypothetical protein EPN59_02760 [Paraburkholderia sp.]